MDSTNASIYAWTIQPGYSEMFPWMSGLAQQYEKYRIRSLRYEFVPRVPATFSGQVVMAIDQDPNDPFPSEDFSGRQVLMSHLGAVSGSVSQHLTMNYPFSLGAERYVRADTDTGTVEPRTADAGVLFVGVFGSAGTVLVGDLIVSYEIEFTMPQLRRGNPGTGANQFSTLVRANLNSVIGGRSRARPLSIVNGAAPVPDAVCLVAGACADEWLYRYVPEIQRHALQFVGERVKKVAMRTL